MSSWRFPIISRSYQSTLLSLFEQLAVLVSVGRFSDHFDVARALKILKQPPAPSQPQNANAMSFEPLGSVHLTPPGCPSAVLSTGYAPTHRLCPATSAIWIYAAILFPTALYPGTLHSRWQAISIPAACKCWASASGPNVFSEYKVTQYFAL